MVAWYDSGHLSEGLGRGVDSITHVAWGTDELRLVWSGELPMAKHTTVCHAANILNHPTHEGRGGTALGQRNIDCGLYMGRLPRPYHKAVTDAALHVKMAVYALWVEKPAGIGEIYNLRPGRWDSLDMERARTLFPSSVYLHPATNVDKERDILGECAFGLVPATTPYAQLLSASKAYDYWALGLPVLIASNVPEARIVERSDIWLGELYDSQHQVVSMEKAIAAIMKRARRSGFSETKRQITRWSKAHHTYRNRAEEIHEFIQS